MRLKTSGAVSVLVIVLMLGCSSGDKSSETQTAAHTETQKDPSAKKETTQDPKGAKDMTKSAADEPQYVQVQHILIGFKGSVPGKNITRSTEEAKALASELLERAQGGGDFDALVKEYTDDAFPGIYSMANFGVEPNEPKMYRRDGMVPAFGNAGFPLEVGGIGMAEYDRQTSPYGWHIVKRLK